MGNYHNFEKIHLMKRFPLLLLSVVFSLLIFSSCKKDDDFQNKPPAANAGSPQTVTLPLDNPIILTGSGSDTDGKVVAYLWSQVSGPNASLIQDPGSASTAVTDLMAGTYIYQLMVVDNLGATGVDTVSLIVNAPLIDTLSLQPTSNPMEVHIWGNNTDLEGSNFPAPDLGAAAWTYNGEPVYERGAVQFDMSTIPSDATITSAHLMLFSTHHPVSGDLVHANGGTDNSMLVQQITSSWDPATVRWLNQPATTTDGQITVAATDQPFLDLDIDVTDMVSGMIKNNTNHGFLIKLQDEVQYNARAFSASTDTDASKHPKLVITYKKNH